MKTTQKATFYTLLLTIMTTTSCSNKSKTGDSTGEAATALAYGNLTLQS